MTEKQTNFQKALDITYKVTPVLTLVFLILSYLYSVKPVFDKEKSLNNFKTRVNILTDSIESKEFVFSSLKSQNDSLNIDILNKQSKINALVVEKRILTIKNTESERELLIKNKELETAYESSVLAHLDRFANDISKEGLIYIYREKDFDIRKYINEYLNNNEPQSKYEIKAKSVLSSYLTYKGEYDVDQGIHYLTMYYRYNYIE